MRINKNFSVLIFFGFLSLALIVYFRSLSIYFLSDDFGYILLGRETSFVNSFKLICQENSLGSGSGLFRPLVDMAFIIAYKIFKLNPVGYHIISLLLHSAMGWLFYLLVYKISDNQKLGLLSGGLFIIYPMNIESVVWLSNWTTLISSFFILLAMNFYWLFRRHKKSIFWCLTLLTVVFSLLAKETAVILPLALIGLDIIWCKVNNWNVKKIYRFWKNYLWVIILVLLFLAWRMVMLGGWGGYRTADGSSIYSSINFSQIYSYIRLIKLFFFNYLNNVIFNINNQSVIIYWITFFVIFSLAVLYVVNSKKTFKFFYLLGGLGWIYVFALPAFNLIGGIHPDLANSRFLYLSSMGFCLVTAILILDLENWRGYRLHYIPSEIMIFLILVFSVTAHKNQETWLQASTQIQRIGQKVQQTVSDPQPESEFYFVNLPDNISGAYCLRNGIENYLLLIYNKPLKYFTAKKVGELPDETKGMQKYLFDSY
ncbi:MAG: hypothetical protein V1898_02525 [Patescibacteria group bacterium]